MINEIKKFLNESFIEQDTVDRIIIDLKENDETCNLTLDHGEFIEIKKTLVESFGDIISTNILSKNCDGIVLNKSKTKINLILIEYKKNIGGVKTFTKVCNQLNHSYLKISLILNFLFKVEDIEVVYVFVGNISDKVQNKVLSSKINKPNLFNMLVRNNYTNIKEIPFNFDIPINDIFKKSNVSFIHKECNSSLNIDS